MAVLKLLGLVAVNLLPLSPALVPLQLVLVDGRPVVRRGIPTKAQAVLGSTGNLWWVWLGGTEGRSMERASYENSVMKVSGSQHSGQIRHLLMYVCFTLATELSLSRHFI